MIMNALLVERIFNCVTTSNKIFWSNKKISKKNFFSRSRNFFDDSYTVFKALSSAVYRFSITSCGKKRDFRGTLSLGWWSHNLQDLWDKFDIFKILYRGTKMVFCCFLVSMTSSFICTFQIVYTSARKKNAKVLPVAKKIFFLKIFLYSPKN